jgi:hypothetical protein
MALALCFYLHKQLIIRGLTSVKMLKSIIDVSILSFSLIQRQLQQSLETHPARNNKMETSIFSLLGFCSGMADDDSKQFVISYK